MFKWFGSKWQSAKRYPEPRYETICEPFAGGCGYSLNYSDRKVRLWDADPLVTELWRWLISEATESAVQEIPLRVTEGTDIRSIGLTRGQSLLLKNWQRTNNAGNCWTISAWGDKPGQWTANTRSRVASQVGAIKHWEVDPFLWESADEEPPATYFVDPPYEKNYQYRQPPIDYELLARNVGRVNGEVIVCEALGKNGEIPQWLPFTASHSSVTSRRKAEQSHHSKEFVYHRIGLTTVWR
jgi:hypothetical protein